MYLFQSSQTDICLKCFYEQGNRLWLRRRRLCVCALRGAVEVYRGKKFYSGPVHTETLQRGEMHEFVHERSSLPRLPFSLFHHFAPSSLPS